MSKISILAVATGGVVDVFATNVATMAVIAGVMVKHSVAHLPPDQVLPTVLPLLESNPAVHVTTTILGGLCSLLGGYIAALIAHHDERLNGLCSSWLCVLIAIYSIAMHPHLIRAEIIVLMLLSPALGYAGGMLRELQVRRKISALPV